MTVDISHQLIVGGIMYHIQWLCYHRGENYAQYTILIRNLDRDERGRWMCEETTHRTQRPTEQDARDALMRLIASSPEHDGWEFWGDILCVR